MKAEKNGPHLHHRKAKLAVHIGSSSFFKLIKSPVLMENPTVTKIKDSVALLTFQNWKIGVHNLLELECNWSIWILVHFGLLLEYYCGDCKLQIPLV